MSGSYGWDDIDRPEYCSCPLPWQTPRGPLKDGSHFSDCLAAEVAEDTAELESIVRALAACEPMVYRDDDYGDDFICGLCDEVADVITREEWKPVEHRPHCPWRRAQAWVGRQR